MSCWEVFVFTFKDLDKMFMDFTVSQRPRMAQQIVPHGLVNAVDGEDVDFQIRYSPPAVGKSGKVQIPLIARLIDWLFGWLIDRLMDWLMDGLFGWLIDWLIDWRAVVNLLLSHVYLQVHCMLCTEEIVAEDNDDDEWILVDGVEVTTKLNGSVYVCCSLYMKNETWISLPVYVFVLKIHSNLLFLPSRCTTRTASTKTESRLNRYARFSDCTRSFDLPRATGIEIQ